MTNKMTAEEAVKILRFEQEQVEHRLDGCSDTQENRNIYEAFSMAIKALEQQPCEDCISRQAALDCFGQTNTRQGAKYAIETLPSVTPRKNLAETSQDCISREEAINEANNISLETSYDNEKVEQMLRDLPSVTPTNTDAREAYIKGYDYGVKDWFISKTQPCEDAISRSDLLQKIQEAPTHLNETWDELYDSVIDDINSMPSVIPKYTDEEIDKAQAVEQAYVDKMVELAVEEAKRPKGKWIHWTDDYKDYCTCSKCGYGEEGELLLKNITPFCPYCGSYNGGGEE